MSQPLLVTSYENPDLDGFSCSLAYAEFLKQSGRAALPCIFGTPHVEVGFVMEKFDFEYPQKPIVDENAAVILLDTCTRHGLPAIFQPEQVVEIVDHHTATQNELFVNARIQIEKVGAAATLLAEKFKTAGIALSYRSAVLLYGGIISNTLNFQAAVTTSRDRDMAEWLNQTARLPEGFPHEIFAAKTHALKKDLNESIRGDFTYFPLGEKAIGIGQLEIIGTTELAASSETAIMDTLNSLKEERNLDYVFLSLIDLEGKFNLFVTDHRPTQTMLQSLFPFQFEGSRMRRPGFIMRKELAPLLQALPPTSPA